MKKVRWTFVLFAGVLTLSLVLSACQPAAQETPTTPTEAQAAPTEAQAASTEVTAPTESPTATEEVEPTSVAEDKVGGNLVWAIAAEPDTLDPAKTGAGVSDLVMGFMGCSLVYLDEQGNAVPYVANSWDVSDDGLTYTFHLRDDVMFDNGDPVTAQDFAWEYTRALDAETASPATGPSLGSVSSITALDDTTLQFVLAEPNFPFLFSLSDPGYMAPVSQAAFEAAGADAYGRAPVGCGPYKMSEWVTGSKVVLERNPDFNWGPAQSWKNTGPWNFDTVEVRIIPEVATITAGLEAGEIDIAGITQNDKNYLETLDTINIEGSLQAGLRPYVAIDTAHPPFDDVNVRKAFNLALDREAMVQVLAQGDAVVQYGPLSPAQIGYWSGVEEIGYGYDPEQAASLMEESGYAKDADGIWSKDGQALSFTLYTLPIENWVKAAEVVQQQLQQFGIEIAIEQDDQGVLIPKILGGDYDITMFGMTYSEADILWLMFNSSQIGAFNYAYVNNPDLDAILDRTRTETDPVARQEAVDEAQKYIVEQAYTIPLYAPINYTAINGELKDYRFSDILGLQLDAAYFEK